MKKLWKWTAIIVAVGAVALVNVKVALDANEANELLMQTVLAFTENGGTESGQTPEGGGGDTSSYAHNHLNNPLPCTIVETYRCEVGIRIPDWVPKIGGTLCGWSYVDVVEVPGTQNLCFYTGNYDNNCDFYTCKKNGQ